MRYTRSDKKYIFDAMYKLLVILFNESKSGKELQKINTTILISHLGIMD